MKNTFCALAALAAALHAEPHYFSAVLFTDPNNGYVLGDSGSLFRTVDAGEHWSEQELGTNWNLDAICFPTATTGYIVGAGTLLKTTDAGAHWSDPGKYKTGEWLNSVFFTSADVGHVVGLVIQEKTVNGGVNWTTEGDHIGLGNVTFRDVFFTDGDHGFVVGMDGNIFKTSDGGTTWDSVPVVTDKDLRAVHFPTSTVGYAVGEDGVILKTSNGGAAWTVQNSHTDETLNDVFFVDAANGYAVGAEYYPAVILKTTNGGVTWTSIANSFTGGLTGVYFTDANTGYAVGFSGELLKTTDAGAHWTGKLSAAVRPGISEGPGFSLSREGKLSYTLAAPARVGWKLVDARGGLVFRGRAVDRGVGEHAEIVPLRALGPGAYFLDFQAGNRRRSLVVPR